jgi:predicted DCC family thiol-disulfide oxidoreductase YuxK
VLACFTGRAPLGVDASIPFIGFLLLAHACVPSAPYGSWAARGRTDPGGGWSMPRPIWGAVWVVLALGYVYGGWAKLHSASWIEGSAVQRILESPFARPTSIRDLLLWMSPILRPVTYLTIGLELAFPLLALSSRARGWIWTVMLVMQAALAVLFDFAGANAAMMIAHAFAFDPAWVRPRAQKKPSLLFYDGACGLCHRTVRMLLAEDTNNTFRFAALGGETFEKRIPAEKRLGLPDSIVVFTEERGILVRSEAVLHLLRGIGGAWGLIAMLAQPIPRGLRDWTYDLIASVRHKIFARPKDACPVMPKALRERFDP